MGCTREVGGEERGTGGTKLVVRRGYLNFRNVFLVVVVARTIGSKVSRAFVLEVESNEEGHVDGQSRKS